MKPWLNVAILLCSAATLPAADERPAEHFDPDVQRLAKVEIFAFGPVGLGGGQSQGEASFAAIVKKREAIRYLLAAFEGGSAAARCYALVGLRESSPAFFRAAMTAFRETAPKKIHTMSGCIMSDEDVERVLQRIESGAHTADFRRHEGTD